MADLTGGDLFEADTVKLYEADYYACIGEAKRNCGKAPESGLSIHGAEVANSRSKVESWVRKRV